MADVRFQLIATDAEWQAVEDLSQPAGAGKWNSLTHTMGLAPKTPLFPRGRNLQPLTPEIRRGAASDRFGSWYWIGKDNRTIYRAPAATSHPLPYWQPNTAAAPAHPGEFVAKTQALDPTSLCGLVVTAHHYLVVGCQEPAGLLVFDLHAGGDPLRLEIPGEDRFNPFDLAARPDGGVWVLDRANHRLWGLDRYFRLLPVIEPVATVPESGSFNPVGSPIPPLGPPAPPDPQGLLLPAIDPTAVTVLPDGSVLVLDEPAMPGKNSRLLFYQPGSTPGSLVLNGGPFELPGLAEISAEPVATPVVAHDMAYLEDNGLLYVVGTGDNQAIAYLLHVPEQPWETLSAEPQAIYLPVHYFGGRALVIGTTPLGDRAVFYDVNPPPGHDRVVRWVRLQTIDQPRYADSVLLEIPVMDSHLRGTTWHRLFLDACIPPETQMQVQTRSGDDVDLLSMQPYQAEPLPYLRSRGSEIPYWDAWPIDPSAAEPDPDTTGTWEVLFQHAAGQYLQIRLALSGNGRASPQIRRLRAYYPRISYVKQYLPAAYQANPQSGNFLERYLANMEGFYADLENRIAGVSQLFDPRSAPPEALDWLATWIGLVLDPLWSNIHDVDRRRLVIRFGRRLYERRGTPDGLRFSLQLLLNPCLEIILKRLERATIIPDLGLRLSLESLGLPYPALGSTAAELEDLLYWYVLESPGHDRVRIVERWQTRQGLALQAGDTTAALAAAPVSLEDDLRNAAHIFSVLLPQDLPDDQAAMVEKIIRLEKPAHTDFDMRRFWDYFLVGTARLGMDTSLGEEGRFLPIILGRDYLSEGYLENAHPMDVTERAVSDRDRMGDMLL